MPAKSAKLLPSLPPFERYRVYGPYYHIREKRTYVAIVGNRVDRTSMSYARYLVSIREGRNLTDTEEVDHIDGDCTNDNESNLQLLSRHDHRIKHPGRGRTMIDFICDRCGKPFQKEARQTHQRSKHTYCSRKCKGNGLT